MAKSNRQNKRITAEVDFSSLGLRELNEVTAALAALEQLGERGIIKFQISAINASKKRGRASPELPPLQPQTQQVWELLISNTHREFTAEEIARAIKIKENSVRGQLHTLLKRGLVTQKQKDAMRKPGQHGPKIISIWSAAEHARV